MDSLTIEKDLRVVLQLGDESWRWLVVFQPLRTEDDLVNELSLVHLEKSFVVDGQLVDRLWEVKNQTEDLGAAMQLLHEPVHNASFREPLLDKVSGYEGVIEVASVVINDSIEAYDWCLRVLLDV